MRPALALAVSLTVSLAPLAAGDAFARTDELGPFGPLPHGGHAGSAPRAEGVPPLFSGLGGLSFPGASANPAAQAYFDQGLRWAWAFNHEEARRAFVQAGRLDPGCALCAWGEALVLGPNLNKPMDPADYPAAVAALRRAQALAANAPPRTQALVAALGERYAAAAPADRSALDRAYADAMAKVADRFPDDRHIRVLAAEAMMDTQPWDYWQEDKKSPKGYTARVVALLEEVLAEEPSHPGAIHLYIHAVEASDSPERALPHARRLEGQMPDAGHIVHMPSHIYYRLGMWRDSLEANRRAVAADERYFARAGEGAGIYRDGYYPHNIHFLLVSAQMAGDGPTTIEASDKLAATLDDEGAKRVPWSQPIKAAPYFAHAQFSPPRQVLELPPPGPGLPYVEAMWHYARGTAQAGAGDAAAARREADAITALADDPGIAALDGQGVPASQVLKLARLVVLGRAEQAEGDAAAAARLFTEAVALEDSLSYTEPPWWYYPVRQSLGAVQLMAGDARAAEATFTEALERVPNNGWALWGLAQAQRKQGRHDVAAETEKAFRRAWAGGRVEPQLAGL